jgi:molybdopterin biosynthesis enzyme
MQLVNLPIEQAIDAILVHNIVDADGRKALSKGHRLTADDVDKLRALEITTVYVARLDADDVREDDAALRLAQAIAGDNIELSKAISGRVNFFATKTGLLKINRLALKRINELKGITLATKPGYTLLTPRKMLATLKTIGLALPEATLRRAEDIVRECGKVIDIVAPHIQRTAILLTGSDEGKQRTADTFLPPIRARIAELGGQVIADAYVNENAEAIAITLTGLLGAGAQLVIIAGETSVMDADDITPRGIQQAGGQIELYGAPVEPGNLLLLAYRGDVPIVGAPGCVKSRETNVVDLILPRLMLGEKISRADVAEMAEGGLLI